MIRRLRLKGIPILLVVWSCVSPAGAMGPSNVLVLYNPGSPSGSAIADYYAQVHPGVQTLAIQNVPAGEVTDASTYLNVIRPQVLAALGSSIDCIVTTTGLPLRISNPKPAGTSGAWSQYSSLESELTRIDTINTPYLMGKQNEVVNALAGNPYGYASGPFSHAAYGIRLSTRLDGWSVSDVESSIDRAQQVYYGAPNQTFIVDDDPVAPAATSDHMPQLVNNVLAPRGIAYTYNNTTAFIRTAPGAVLGYDSHGVHGGAPANYVTDPVNGLNLVLAPGAIFQAWESYNAYSFQAGGNRYGQGLVADWIHIGGTAGVGTVEEPYASDTTVVNEDRMWEELLSGYTWAEAAWNATIQLSYVNTVVGDPLMTFRPWPYGTVDMATLNDVYNDLGRTGVGLPGDVNMDGTVDTLDLNLVYNSLGTAMGPVPEPASASLLVLAGLGLISRRRAR